MNHHKLVLATTTIVRILAAPIAFTILSPFPAYLINTIFDGCDGPIYKHILKLDPEKAQRRDKLLDLWLYTVTVVYSTLNYQWFTPILIGCYLYRLAGQVIFFATQDRRTLVYFPNLFEVAFFYFYLTHLYSIPPAIEIATLVILFTIIVAHEMSLHIYQVTFFDNLLKPILGKIKTRGTTLPKSQPTPW